MSSGARIAAAQQALQAGDLERSAQLLGEIPLSTPEGASAQAMIQRLPDLFLEAANGGQPPKVSDTRCATVSELNDQLPTVRRRRVVGEWVRWPLYHLDPVESRYTTAVFFRCSGDERRGQRMKAAFKREQFPFLVSRVGRDATITGRIGQDVLGTFVLNPVVVVFSDGQHAAAPELAGRF